MGKMVGKSCIWNRGKGQVLTMTFQKAEVRMNSRNVKESVAVTNSWGYHLTQIEEFKYLTITINIEGEKAVRE